MSELVVAVVSFVVVVATNAYWWRRVRTVEDSLRLSRDRALEVATEPAESSQPSSVALQEAARAADVTPEDLPARVDGMNEEIRTLNKEVDDLRSAWANSWWDALSRPAVRPDEPNVIVVPLSEGDVDTAQTFSNVAVEHDSLVAIVLGLQDGSVTVTVGEGLRDNLSAVTILDEITEQAGGGGGGSPSFATGGGTREDELESAAEAVRNEIESRV